MPTVLTKIYENSNLTVKARIDKSKVASIEEVTFRFQKDGEQFEEKTIPMRQGRQEGDHAVVSHVVKAPPVDDDKSSYFLDYHYFYKVKNLDASTEVLQNFPASRIQVFPRTGQLKVTDKEDKAFPRYEFMVEQGGERSEVWKTVAGDTPNAKGETIPAGSCEFNLGLFPTFRIVPSPPYQIAEEVVGAGRKREIKGSVGFRALFVMPGKGNIRQYVNYDVENQGQTGLGDTVTIEVGVHPDDLPFLKAGDSGDSNVVQFRVTYGPDAEEPVAKSERDDADHPTKVVKVNDADETATIEEKEPNKKYEGKVKLTNGAGKFVVKLGKAGGDTCRIEISGSDKFLTETLAPDATLTFENWRRVHYEMLLPDIMTARATPVLEQVRRRLDGAGRQLFIEFHESAVRTFTAVKQADLGTLAPQRFLGGKAQTGGIVYILSGRNWRRLPDGQDWSEEHPGKTLRVIICDAILSFRTDTADEQKGTSDITGTLKEATGSINVEEQLGGLFMPFSGFDGGDGLSELEWTADISKDDEPCKYTAELEIVEARKPVDSAAMGSEMSVLAVSDSFNVAGADVRFARLPNEGTEEGTEPEENEEQRPFNPELSEEGVEAIQGLVDGLFASIEALVRVKAKVKVRISAPADTGHEEDACFAAVKDKLQELFDASEKKEFVFHPGLDEKPEPRTGTSSMQDVTIGPECTVTEWRFQLPVETPQGDPGPGSFVGKEKTRDQCPVKVAFSAQAHELSEGEVAGNLLAWICDKPTGPRQFLRLVLRGFQAVEDTACRDHGHGAEGFPGDCLAEAASLCEECVKHARSRNLTRI